MRARAPFTDWRVRACFVDAYSEAVQDTWRVESKEGEQAAAACKAALATVASARTVPASIRNTAKELSADAGLLRAMVGEAIPLKSDQETRDSRGALTAPQESLRERVWDQLARRVPTGELALSPSSVFQEINHAWGAMRTHAIRRIAQGERPNNLREELAAFVDAWGPHPEAIHLLVQLSMSRAAPSAEMAWYWSEQRLEIYPDDPNAALDRILVELTFGQPAKALDLVRNELASWPGHLGLRLANVEALAASGLLQETRLAVAIAQKEGWGDQAVVRWACGLMRLKAVETAVSTLREWIRKYGHSPEFEARMQEEPCVAALARRVIPPMPRREGFGSWFLRLPYQDRQLIVTTRGEEAAEGEFVCGVLGLRTSLTKAMMGAAASSTLQVRRVPADLARRVLVFPPGNPLYSMVYAGHPRRPPVYLPVADFHRWLFEEKYNELLLLLSALGAVSIEIHCIRGYREELRAGGGLTTKSKAAGSKAEATRTEQTRAEGHLHAHFEKSREAPHLPEAMVWYPCEETWKRVADARLHCGLRDIDVELRYGEDYGITYEVALGLESLGLKLGGDFYRHQETLWRFIGEFG
jgi:hypothetical protein